MQNKNLIDKLSESSDFNVLAKTKLSISKVITNAMVEKNVSMRQLAEEI